MYLLNNERTCEFKLKDVLLICPVGHLVSLFWLNRGQVLFIRFLFNNGKEIIQCAHIFTKIKEGINKKKKMFNDFLIRACHVQELSSSLSC